MLFGWYIVGYLFLAGAGSGAFLLSASSCMVDAYQRTDESENMVSSTQAGFFVAPCMVALAALLLMFDLGGIDRAWRVMLNPFQSLVSIGAWLIALFLLASGLLTAVALVKDEVPKNILWPGCILGSLLAIGVMVYAGMLLASMVSIDFWRTPWLVVLFVASAISTGAAAITLLDVFALPASMSFSHDLRAFSTTTSAFEAVALTAFMISRWFFSPVARASAIMLLSGELAPAFWIGVVGFGLAIPLAIRIVGQIMPQRTSMLIFGASVLAGGLMLRYCIIAAAQYTPYV